MSLVAMPVLVINLGGEMVYILEQRLQAQSISSEKSKRVLQDVVRTMFNPSFIAELFKTQEIYSYESIRGIFDRLAHSSIMRLSENSMNKLYDLMTMGFKYQLLSCTYPGEIKHVTFNHLDSMRRIIDSPAIGELVDNVAKLTTQMYSGLTFGQFDLLRQTVLSFFQDKRVKVSLFLQEGLQNSDGSIVLVSSEYLPPYTECPGTVVYHSPASTATFTTSNTGKVFTGKDRTCALGMNLYLKSSKKKSKPKKKKASSAGSKASKQAPQPDGKAAQVEMSLLAGLIGHGSPTKEDAFKINLFPELRSMDGSSNPNAAADVVILETDDLDADGMLAQNPELASVFADMTVEDDAGEEEVDDNDLLALMDMA